ncbi:MAG: cupin domain-containing protein [Cyclobacteriaceae bacterium]|nr:cupin domain-containing protein [Cyclobacteriaceae bacterium]
MHPPEFWIENFHLHPHPEGGFYKETYRSAEKTERSSLPARYEGARHFSTAIYFLLRSQDRSVFHRIQSDELWHFYAGTTLLIYVFEGTHLKTHRLGADPAKGDSLQVLIPAGCWFGAVLEAIDSYALCGCTVAPGFDFTDFEMATRKELLTTYPGHTEIIELLTRG